MERVPPELPDDAIVIRGGTNQREVMRQQAEDEFEATGRYALSVATEAGWTLEQIAAASKRQNRAIRKTTVGRLRAVGFSVTPPTGRKKHADLILPTPPKEEDWIALDEAFDPPERNPYNPSMEVKINGERA